MRKRLCTYIKEKPHAQYLYQEEINRTLLLTTTLLSDEVTNCLYPVCQQIKGELGEFSIMLRQMFSKIEDF